MIKINTYKSFYVKKNQQQEQEQEQEQQQSLHHMDDRRTQWHDHTPLGGRWASTTHRPMLSPYPRLPALVRQDTTFHGILTTEDTHSGIGLISCAGPIEQNNQTRNWVVSRSVVIWVVSRSVQMAREATQLAMEHQTSQLTRKRLVMACPCRDSIWLLI